MIVASGSFIPWYAEFALTNPGLTFLGFVVVAVGIIVAVCIR